MLTKKYCVILTGLPSILKITLSFFFMNTRPKARICYKSLSKGISDNTTSENEINISKENQDFNTDSDEKNSKIQDPVIKAIIYVRVSSKIQKDGISLSVQEAFCREFCQCKNWKVIRTIREVVSAKDPCRQTELQRVSEKKFSNPTMLVVYNISRFSRNVSKGLDLVRKMRDNRLILVSSTEVVDLSSASGEYNLINLLNAAELESKLISMRVSDALAHKKVPVFFYHPSPYSKERHAVINWDFRVMDTR